MKIVEENAARDGVAPTCAALGLPRATCYRRRRPRAASGPRPPPRRALSAEEQSWIE